MGIEDRLREDLRRSARTARDADVLPEDLSQKIQHRIAPPQTRRRRSGRDRGGRVGCLRGHAPVARHRVHWRSRPASRESDRALRRGKAVPALWSADAALAVLRSLALP